jgi:hypothetical protein
MSDKTFRDQLHRRDKLLHKVALWGDLRTYLQKFVDGDQGPAQVGIASQGSGFVVTQDVLLDADLQLEFKIAELNEELRKLDEGRMADEPTPEESSQGTATKKGKGGKGSRPLAAKG